MLLIATKSVSFSGRYECNRVWKKNEEIDGHSMVSTNENNSDFKHIL